MNYDFIKIAKKYLSLLEEIEHAYLFGSVLVNSKEPNDIDVLIIYSKYSDYIDRFKNWQKYWKLIADYPLI